MELWQLRTFRAVAENLNFTKASEQLFLTQSAVSHQIKALEEDFGVPLFIRGMAETIRAKLAHFGKDGLEPGDILVTNDSYVTGSHLNHIREG